MLKKGLAWHYTAYDRRMELSKVTTNKYSFTAQYDAKDSFIPLRLRRAFSEHFCNHVHEVPDERVFSVGESGTGEPNRVVGITRS